MIIPEFFINNWLTLLVYAVIIGSVVFYRKKFEWQGIIALRRTTFGISFMSRYAKKHKETLKILGYSFIGIGFVGMIFIFGYVFYSLYQLLFVPLAPASFAIVLPGVNIPGSAIFIPIWVLIPLFIVVLIHEAGHGLVAKANGVPIKKTGIVFFGPLAGAFVEPDEKKLEKKSDVVKYSVFASGPGMNFLTGGIAFLLMLLVLNPLAMAMVSPVGFSFQSVQEGLPADLAGVQPGIIYTMINNQSIITQEDLALALQTIPAESQVIIANEEVSYIINSTIHPQDQSRGYLGILGVATDFDVKENVPRWIYFFTHWLTQFFLWIVILSLGLGLFNLLPLGPVDGGQMTRLAFLRTKGEKKGYSYWLKLSWFLFIVVLFLIFWPIIKSLLF